MQTKFLLATVLLSLIVCGFGLYGQDLVGDTWLMSENRVVTIGQEFTVSVHVNTGTQMLAAYTFSLQGNSSLLMPVPDSIVAGPDGSYQPIVIPGDDIIIWPDPESPYPVNISNFDVNGKGPGVNLNVVQLRFRAIAAGTSQLTLNVTTLSDPATNSIGTPRGIGTTITVVDPALTYGDADNNGKVDIADALFVARYAAGLIQTLVQPQSGDVNADGKVDISDATLIARYSAGLIKDFIVLVYLTVKNTELVPVYPDGIPPAVVEGPNWTLSARLRDVKGIPITGKKVDFSGNLMVGPDSATTDVNGIATAQVSEYAQSQEYTTTFNASYISNTTYLGSSCRIKAKIMPSNSITPTPIRTPTPTPLNRVPYYLPASYVKVQINSTANGVIAGIDVMLPTVCTSVDSWGEVVRQGNTFSVDTITSDTTMACVLMLGSAAHSYNLGTLEQGSYVFNFYNMGRLLQSVDFVIMN